MAAWNLARSWRLPFEQSFQCSFARVQLVIGPEADSHLAAAGAIALACDPLTILISSRVMALCEEARRLLIGHELAHTVQLVRGGDDKGESLEAEAWRAVANALRGRVHEVRGGSSRSLCAKGLIDPKNPGIHALDFYKTFGKEPVDSTNSVAVQKPEFVDPMNLLSLLDRITTNYASWKDSDLLIVSHGNKDGMVMQLFEKRAKKYYANTTSLKALMTTTAADLARGTGFKEADLQSLIDKMKAVRALGIGNLHFRSCSIGASKASLETLRDFFGAKSASAPDILSNFGALTPVLKKFNEKEWDRLLPVPKGGNAEEMVSPKGERIRVRVNPASGMTHALAESNEATKFWIGQRIPSDGSWSYGGGQFPIHSLSTTPRVTFPLEAGYVSHIVSV